MEPREQASPGAPRAALPRAPRAHEKGRAGDRISDDASAAFEALEAPHAIAATFPLTNYTYVYPAVGTLSSPISSDGSTAASFFFFFLVSGFSIFCRIQRLFSPRTIWEP